MPKTFWEYVQKPSRSGIIIAMRAALIRSKLTANQLETEISNKFSCLSVSQKEDLFDYFSSCEPANTLTGSSNAYFIFTSLYFY